MILPGGDAGDNAGGGPKGKGSAPAVFGSVASMVAVVGAPPFFVFVITTGSRVPLSLLTCGRLLRQTQLFCGMFTQIQRTQHHHYVLFNAS